MGKAAVVLHPLQRVPKRVPKVENGAFAGVAFIALHDLPLNVYTGVNHFCKVIAAVLSGKAVKQRFVADAAVFNDFPHAVRKESGGQSGKCLRVNQHQRGLVERTYQIFTLGQVHTGFAADGGIHLRKQRGRNLDKWDTAQPRCRRKTGHIAADTAAQRHCKVGAGQVRLGKSRVKRRNRR